MLKFIQLMTLVLATVYMAQAVGNQIFPGPVTIGSQTKPNTSSTFDVVNTSKGSRPCPSMTQVQRDAIVSPAAGLCVFNTNAGLLNYYNGTSWEKASGEGVLLWTTATAYTQGEVVHYNDFIYYANADHTSGTFATDLANGLWVELANNMNRTASGTMQAQQTMVWADTTGDNATWTPVTISASGAMAQVQSIAGSGAGSIDVFSPLNTYTVNATRVLVASTTQASQPCPSMSEAQRDLVAAPSAGLCIWNTTRSSMEVYNGVSWTSVGGGVSDWLTATDYDLGDIVKEGGYVYVALATHTSGTFATDLAAFQWAPLPLGPSLSGEENCIPRWAASASPVLDESLLCVNDSGDMGGIRNATFTGFIQSALGLTVDSFANGKVLISDADAVTEATNLAYNNSTHTMSLTGVMNVDNLQFDGNSILTTSGNITINPTGAGAITLTDAVAMSSTANVSSLLNLDNNLSMTSATATIRKTNNTSVLSITGGSTTGSDNGAQVILYGSQHASAASDLILSSGSGFSGSGDILFKSGSTQTGELDLNGRWTLGVSGGTQSHIINGNLNGSGSGYFAGQLVVAGNIIGSGSGQLSGNLDILTQGDLRLQDSAGGEYVALQASATVSSYTVTMPSSQGAASNTLINDGSGNLTWAFPTAVPTFLTYSTATDYTVLDNDGYAVILVTDSSPTKTITLPTASANTNRRILVKNISSDQGSVTVDGESTEAIDGYATVSLGYKGAFIEIVCDGANWHVVATNLGTWSKRYALTVTASGWTADTDGSFIRYAQSIDGTHVAEVRFAGSYSGGAVSGIQFTASALTFKNTGSNQGQACSWSVFTASSLALTKCTFDDNASTINFNLTNTFTSSNFQFGGVAELESKPTSIE